MKRNAYFWAVDPDGNQLPYIDELYRFSGLDGEVVNLKALAGELDIAGVDFETYSLAKEREGDGKIVAMKYANTTFVEAGLQFNLTHKDPVLRKIFADKRFRFAASHAVNREQINQLVYYGLTEPWQAAPWENSVYYHERLAHTALEHDPDMAKALLAEMGLTAGADGMLVRPDGEKLQINLVTYGGRKDRIAELIADDLKAVGVDVNLRAMNGGQAYQLIKGNDLDAIIMGGPEWEVKDSSGPGPMLQTSCRSIRSTPRGLLSGSSGGYPTAHRESRLHPNCRRRWRCIRRVWQTSTRRCSQPIGRGSPISRLTICGPLDRQIGRLLQDIQFAGGELAQTATSF